MISALTNALTAATASFGESDSLLYTQVDDGGDVRGSIVSPFKQHHAVDRQQNHSSRVQRQGGIPGNNKHQTAGALCQSAANHVYYSFLQVSHHNNACLVPGADTHDADLGMCSC